MELNRLQKLAGLPLTEAKKSVEVERTYNFNEMLRTAKKVSIDNRGGRDDLYPHILVTLKNGDEVIISGDDDLKKGKKIAWGYEDENGEF